jgi:outer membrane assembly lipoprotein YfiO
MLVTLSIAVVLLWALPAEAKFVFRDGKWVFVPDNEDLPKEPPPAQPPSESPKPPEESPKPPEPQPAQPVEPPAVAPPKTDQQPPAPNPAEPATPPAPRVAPAPLVVQGSESVGLKYRPVEASKAADEAQDLAAKAGPGGAAELANLNSLIADFRLGRYSSVASSATRFLKEHPNSAYGEAALWLKCEAVLSDGDYYKAWTVYEDFVKDYAGSRLVDKALVREVQCAEALLGPARRKILGMPLGSGNDEAVAMLEKLHSDRPGTLLAADALLRIAEFRMTKGRFDDAEQTLRQFLKEFPNHERAREAELRSAQCAMAANNGPTYDDASLKRAEDTLRAYQEKYPTLAAEENVPGALEKIRCMKAEKQFQTAAYYARAQRPRAAAFYADLVQREFPGTPAAQEAAALMRELAGKK